MPRSAPTALHLRDTSGYYCQCDICLSESFSLDGSRATPKACRSMIASTPSVGASSPDCLRTIYRRSIPDNFADRTWSGRKRVRRRCHFLAGTFLASPWAKGSMSVCLGSSASGGPAPEAGTSLTAHASAHEPEPEKRKSTRKTNAGTRATQANGKRLGPPPNRRK